MSANTISNPSVSNTIDRMPQHIARYYIDYGSHIAFPKELAYSEFPAGLYLPDRSDEGNFVLTRIDPFRRQALLEMHRNNRIRDEAEQDAQATGNAEFDSFIEQIELEDLAFMEEMERITQQSSRTPANPVHSRMSDKHSVSATALSSLNRLERGDYLSEGYFPLEKYNPGLKRVSEAISEFLQNRRIFVENRLGYRRSVLLFGEPGTGKSRFIDNLCKQLIQMHKAVVIRIDSRFQLELVVDKGLVLLETHLADRLKIFIIEELAEMSSYRGNSSLLNFLDNAILRNNVIYLMTTNNPDRVPKNLTDRPSRIDVLEEAGRENLPGFQEAWYKHVTGQELPESEKHHAWYSAKMTPAYLKELFLLSRMKGIQPHEAYGYLEHRIKLVKNNFAEKRELGFG